MNYLKLAAILMSGLIISVHSAQAGSYHSVRTKLGQHGYHALVTTDRTGPVYGFSSCKRGKSYKLRVNRRGRILRRKKLGACTVRSHASKKYRGKKYRSHVRISAPYTRVRVRGRHVKVKAPYTRVKVRGKHVKVKAPYTRVKVRGRHVKVKAPYTKVRVSRNQVRVRNPWVNLHIKF